MINLKILISYVTFMSVCAKYTVSVYDAAESLEVLTTYDEEFLTTSISKNFEDDFQTADVTTQNSGVTTSAPDITTLGQEATTSVEKLTTTTENMSTTAEDIFTTLEDVYTTVKKFVYRTHDLNVNETKKKTEMQVGKVYTILESLISDSDNKTENKEDGDFEDMTEEIATVPYEITTYMADYADIKYGDVISVEPPTIDHKVNINRNPQCPHFIDSAGFKIEKIANVWQPVYSDMQDKLPCFKILIRKTLEVEREQYEQWHGNFNEVMNWKECHFEIKSAAVKYRKHFLQGGVGDKGVMRNILLVQNKRGDYDLEEDNPDQWLMVKNLLFLHDCKTGETIAFARVPSHPCKAVVTEALQELGLKMTGKMLLCDS